MLPGVGFDGAPVYYFLRGKGSIDDSPRFQRVWIQGVVVHRRARLSGDGAALLVVDDSTGPPVIVRVPATCAVHSMRAPEEAMRAPPSGAQLAVGSYVACVGAIAPAAELVAGEGEDTVGEGAPRTRAKFGLVAERLQDLTGTGPQREAMWNVEVPEAYKMLELTHKERNRTPASA